MTNAARKGARIKSPNIGHFLDDENMYMVVIFKVAKKFFLRTLLIQTWHMGFSFSTHL